MFIRSLKMEGQRGGLHQAQEPAALQLSCPLSSMLLIDGIWFETCRHRRSPPPTASLMRPNGQPGLGQPSRLLT